MPDPAMSTPPPPPPSGAGGSEWRTVHFWQVQPIRDVMLIALLLGLLYLGYVLSIVTVPLLLAVLLAYLFEPTIARITRLGGGRVFSRRTTVLGLIVGLVVLVALPVLAGVGYGVLQGAGFVNQQARNVRWLWASVEHPEDETLRQMLPGPAWKQARDWLVELKAESDRARDQERQRLRGKSAPRQAPPPAPGSGPPAADPAEPAAPSTGPPTGEPEGAAAERGPSPGVLEAPRPNPAAVQVYRMLESLVAYLEEHSDALTLEVAQTGAGAVGLALEVAGRIGFVLFGAFLTMFFFYFVATSWSRVVLFLRNLIPVASRDRVVGLVRQMDEVIAGFVRGRLTICAIFVVYYTLAFWAIGVAMPLVVGPLVGLLCLVPYASMLSVPLGIGLGFVEPGLFAFQREWWWVVGAPVVVYLLSQVLDDYVLTPRIQGNATGMSMPMILFASLSGGVLAGFYGLLLGIPVAACLLILVREVVWPRFREWTEGRARDPLPMGGAARG
jgi:predicted PurR-regulated permease PerM